MSGHAYQSPGRTIVAGDRSLTCSGTACTRIRSSRDARGCRDAEQTVKQEAVTGRLLSCPSMVTFRANLLTGMRQTAYLAVAARYRSSSKHVRANRPNKERTSNFGNAYSYSGNTSPVNRMRKTWSVRWTWHLDCASSYACSLRPGIARYRPRS